MINDESEGGTNFILLDIGYLSTMIYVMAQGNVDFFRSVNFGGRSIDSLLSNILSLSEEEAVKKKLEFLSDTQPLGDNKVLAVVRPLYGELLEELRKVIQFWGRSDAKKLDKIYLIGGGASLAGLSHHLAEGLGFEVHKLHSMDTIQLNSNKADLGCLVNAAGALIRFSEQVRP